MTVFALAGAMNAAHPGVWRLSLATAPGPLPLAVTGHLVATRIAEPANQG